MTNRPPEHTRTYLLTAGECDARGRMPLWLIVSRTIEVASEHANILGIGYAALINHGIGWVLTRLSIEMKRYPGPNEHYTFTTWIESLNRHFSDRCFVITDESGAEIGHIRSMWMAIDMKARSAADLSVIDPESMPLSPRQCPVPMQRKLRPLDTEADVEQYTFRYCDIDFNRHVNTVQYVKLILNQWELDFFDSHVIRSFAISFHHECHFGMTVDVASQLSADGSEAFCQITHQGTLATQAAMSLTTDIFNPEL